MKRIWHYITYNRSYAIKLNEPTNLLFSQFPSGYTDVKCMYVCIN